MRELRECPADGRCHRLTIFPYPSQSPGRPYFDRRLARFTHTLDQYGGLRIQAAPPRGNRRPSLSAQRNPRDGIGNPTAVPNHPCPSVCRQSNGHDTAPAIANPEAQRAASVVQAFQTDGTSSGRKWCRNTEPGCTSGPYKLRRLGEILRADSQRFYRYRRDYFQFALLSL